MALSLIHISCLICRRASRASGRISSRIHTSPTRQSEGKGPSLEMGEEAVARAMTRSVFCVRSFQSSSRRPWLAKEDVYKRLALYTAAGLILIGASFAGGQYLRRKRGKKGETS